MIVKAVEREVVGKIIEDTSMDVSTAWVMGFFNKTIEKLLKQETKDSLSNAGWDGGIIYYNRRTQVLKFAGVQFKDGYEVFVDYDGAVVKHSN